MSDVNALAGEIGNLFTGVARDIYAKFTQEDKDDLANYGKDVAALTLQLQVEHDPIRRARIVDNLNTYANATRLMVARYEIMTSTAVEKAALSALTLAINIIVKIVIAAV